jgi:ATP-binding cassette subfamily B multidrug efflux pump
MSSPLHPGAAAKPIAFKATARRLAGRLGPQRGSLILVIASGVASVVLAVIGPSLLGRATDLIFAGVIGGRLPAGADLAEIVAQRRAAGDDNLADMLMRMNVVPGAGVDFDALRRVLLIALAVFVGANLLAWLQGHLLAGVVHRMVRDLRTEVERKLNRLPLSYLDGQSRGDVLGRVSNDVENIAQCLQQALSQFLTAVLTVMGVVVMMFVVSPLLAGIALVMLPLTVLITKEIAGRAQRHFKAQWRDTGELNVLIEETFTGHELVKVYGRRRDVRGRFAETNEALLRSSFGAQFVSGLLMPSMVFVGNLSYVVIAVVGALRVASGVLTLGEVQAFIQYSSQFTQPLAQAASTANLLQSAVVSAERVFALLDEPEERPDPVLGTPVPARPWKRVDFENVGFRYRPERPLIENLSLSAGAGQTVAIVGPTGAGKTTLVNLIMRFYELDTGQIRIGGADIAAMRRDALRRQIGVVLQDAWLFGGTIRENIAYGRPEATTEQVLAAARAAHVDRFVQTLPDGYDTVIAEDGETVSAGEKQLITIARAFLADPSLLILDEATSSVDTRTELLVQRAMTALRAGRISFVIAHRLSTIRDADLILVLADGRIVEQGSHAALLGAGGAFHALYSAQFTRPDAGEVAAGSAWPGRAPGDDAAFAASA